ncbi:hypothetical protein [Arcanobacterium haemolyticum]
MIIAVDQVQERLNAALDFTQTPDESNNVATCARDAAKLVGDYIGAAPVPESIAVLAAVEVGRELFTRLGAPGGIYSPFADSAPVRLARDPLKAAYPLLQCYMPGGFA